MQGIDAKLSQAAQNRADIAGIKRKYDSGEISREQAKILAEPILCRINHKTAEIARKHGKKPYKLDFINVMRDSY